MFQILLFVATLMAAAVEPISGLCWRNETFGPCTALDAFPILPAILQNLSALQSMNISLNNTAAISAQKLAVYNLTDTLCRTAQPIINCIEGRDFSACKQEVDSNGEAYLAMSIYNSFRLINFGCTLWFSGGADIETDCPNYDSLFDACADLATNVPTLKDFDVFFESDSAKTAALSPPRINASDCEGFKLRTGCIVTQFQKGCSSPRSAELPWWMARYQLDLSQTYAVDCQFTSDDTADKLAQHYQNWKNAGAGKTTIAYIAQSESKSSASTVQPSAAVIFGQLFSAAIALISLIAIL